MSSVRIGRSGRLAMTGAAIRAIALFTMLEASRNRLLWLVVGLIVAGFGLTEFIGEVAITETGHVQSGFLGAMLRAGTVFITALFVVTSIVREFDDKVLELVLSQPIPRSSYFLGKLLGFSGIAVVSVVLCGLCLLLYVPPLQVILWSVSLWCELVLVVALSLLCLFTFSHVTAAMSAVLAFYVIARAIAALRLIAESPLIATDSWSQDVIGWLIEALAFVLPALDRFTPTEWLVYHTGTLGGLGPIVGQSVIYVALLSGAAMFDLYRRNL